MSMSAHEEKLRLLMTLDGSREVERKFGTLTGKVTKFDKGLRTVNKTYDNGKGVITQYTATMDKADKVIHNTYTDNEKLKRGFLGTGDSIGKIIAKVTTWSIATGVLFGSLSALRKGLGVITEFDSKMVGLQKVFNGTANELAMLKSDILNTSVEMGSLTGKTLEASIELGRMGKRRAEISELMRVSLLAQNIAEMDAAKSTRFLNSAILQFEKQVDDAIVVLDQWNTLSNKTPAETIALAEATSVAGAVIHDAGGEIEDLNAYVTTLTATMAKSGREIGTAMRTITTYIYRQSTMKKIFELTGIAVQDAHGNLMDIDDLLPRLAAKWTTLTEAQQEELAQSMAGVRRKSFLLNLMKNFDMVLDSQIKQWGAAGSAMRENEIRLQSLATKVLQLQAALEKLAVKGGDTGLILPFLKAATDDLRTFIDNLGEAHAAAQLLAGVGVAGAIVGFQRLVLVIGTATTATKGLTMAMGVLSKGFYKWLAVIMVAISAWNLIIGVFTRSARILREQKQELDKFISSLNVEKATLISVIDAFQFYNATYQEYLNLRKKGQDTSFVEERLLKILEGIDSVQPGVISSTNNYSKALKELKSSARDAKDRIQSLKEEIAIARIQKIDLSLPDLQKQLENVTEEALDETHSVRVLKKSLGDINKLEKLRHKLVGEANGEITDEIKSLNSVITALKEINQLESEKRTIRNRLNAPIATKKKSTPTKEDPKIQESLDLEKKRHELAMAKIEGDEAHLTLLDSIAEKMTDIVAKEKLQNQIIELRAGITKRGLAEQERLIKAELAEQERLIEAEEKRQEQIITSVNNEKQRHIIALTRLRDEEEALKLAFEYAFKEKDVLQITRSINALLEYRASKMKEIADDAERTRIATMVENIDLQSKLLNLQQDNDMMDMTVGVVLRLDVDRAEEELQNKMKYLLVGGGFNVAALGDDFDAIANRFKDAISEKELNVSSEDENAILELTIQLQQKINALKAYEINQDKESLSLANDLQTVLRDRGYIQNDVSPLEQNQEQRATLQQLRRAEDDVAKKAEYNLAIQKLINDEIGLQINATERQATYEENLKALLQERVFIQSDTSPLEQVRQRLAETTKLEEVTTDLLEKEKLILEIEKLKNDELRLQKSEVEQLANYYGRLTDIMMSGVSDSLMLSITEGATRAQKLDVWNRVGQNIGQQMGSKASLGIQEAMVDAAMGNALTQMVTGNIVGGLVTAGMSLLTQALFPSDDPVQKEDEAIEENTRSLRELTDAVSKLNEHYFNAPADFVLGATAGEVPQLAISGEILKSGMIYAHAGEQFGQPEQLYGNHSETNVSHRNDITIGEVNLLPREGQDGVQLADEFMETIGGYRRGDQYKSTID